MSTIALTGASGFVGRHLARRFAERGHRVRALLRNLDAPVGDERFLCDLPDRVDERAFAGADLVVHAAFASAAEAARRVNEEGSRRLLALARAAGARFLFVSSTAAHAEALSEYGRGKLAFEGELDPARDLAVRPGLVLGDGGLALRIARSLRRHGVVPVVGGGRQQIQTVHIDDLAEAFARAVERVLTGTLVVAEPEPLELRELFRLLARALGTRCVLVPVPGRPLAAALRLLERLGAQLPISSENVLGALALRAQASAESLARLGLTIRTARESVSAVAAALAKRP